MHTLIKYTQFVWLWSAIITSICATFASQVATWICFWPILLRYERLRVDIMGRFIRFWSIMGGLVTNPFWGFKVVRPAPIGYKPTDTLLMVNHTSSADAYIVSASTWPWEFKYIFKSDLYNLPIAGWSVWLGYDVPIYFTKEKGGWGTEKGSVSKCMDNVKRLQDLGFGQVIFPEGTRSKSGRLQPFKDGFFRFAVDHKCEILPCVLHNSQALWPMGGSMFGTGTAYFAFGDPFRVVEGDTVEGLKSKVRDSMVELFSHCPLYDPLTESPLGETAGSRGQGIRG
eukprot:Lankesteria_metandrocarpae@DN1730_c0_g1_i1.p1